jgi:serine/threonine protein kinase
MGQYIQKLFSGTSNRELTAKIAEQANLPVGDLVIERFSDGEIWVKYNENLRGNDVYIVQSTNPPGDNIIELALLIDGAKRASAEKVNVVIPYFGYSRQDRKDQPRVPISAKVMMDIFTQAGADRIITMDWMKGEHLSEFTAYNNNKELSNKLGQALWDFYMHQLHNLKKVHADPHPGNFLVSKEGDLIALDFGCMKSIPTEFYVPYFELAIEENIENPEFFLKKLYELEILREDDSPEEIDFFKELFYELLSLFTKPFNQEVFDFSDPLFFQKITELGERYSKSTELRKMNGNRGSKHFIYINRTFFGLYNLMFDLKANEIQINNYKKL